MKNIKLFSLLLVVFIVLLSAYFLLNNNRGINLYEEVDKQNDYGITPELLLQKEQSCLTNNGQWFGGPELICEIDNQMYQGNWEESLALQADCENQNGAWVDKQENACQIDGYIYPNASWVRLEEMKVSCLEYNGEFLAGPKFTCRINGELYNDKKWENLSVAPDMAAVCEADGGIWLDEYRECEGLPIDWCIKAESTFSEVRGLTFNECASACRHNPEAEMCTMQCIPVCSLGK